GRSGTRTSTATTCGPCTRRIIREAEPARVASVREGGSRRAGAPPKLRAPAARRPGFRRRGSRSSARGRPRGRDRERRAGDRLLLGGVETAAVCGADTGTRAGRGG